LKQPWGLGRSTDTHLTYMINICLTTDFVLAGQVPSAGTYGQMAIRRKAAHKAVYLCPISE